MKGFFLYEANSLVLKPPITSSCRFTCLKNSWKTCQAENTFMWWIE